MNRYLLNISYIGTRFRGVQKTVIKSDPELSTATIQGSLELALRLLHPVNYIQTHLSSRTDAGVHALQSSIHVDLERHNGEPYDEEALTVVLNKAFDKHNLPIRILNALRVPNTFHCRYNAKERTYLYRFAVAKDGPPGDVLRNRNYLSFIPVEELKRCYFIQDHKFDIELFKEAANLFKGRHDFRTFMSTSRKDDKGPMFTIRRISDIKIYSGKSIAIQSDADRADSLYSYWNVEISGKSFLYKQVRRIVGSLVTLACHRITLKDVHEMLTIPSKATWHPRIAIAPPFGLYLRKVHYDEADLQLPQVEDELTSTKHESSTAAPVEEEQAQAN